MSKPTNKPTVLYVLIGAACIAIVVFVVVGMKDRRDAKHEAQKLQKALDDSMRMIDSVSR